MEGTPGTILAYVENLLGYRVIKMHPFAFYSSICLVKEFGSTDSLLEKG